MPRAAKISDEELRAELAAGATQKQIAAKYAMDVANVSRRVAKIKSGAAEDPGRLTVLTSRTGRTARNVVPVARGKSAKTGLPADGDEISMWDTKAAADENFARVRELLGQKYFADTKTRVRIHAEIRAHLELGVRVMETLYAIQEQAAFQALVLEILDEFDESARERILDRMRERRALRKAVEPHRGTLRPESD